MLKNRQIRQIFFVHLFSVKFFNLIFFQVKFEFLNEKPLKKLKFFKLINNNQRITQLKRTTYLQSSILFQKVSI